MLTADNIAVTFNKNANGVGDQPLFLLRDFNRCEVTTFLPNLEQYVTSATRLDKTLDLCYGNIPSAYISKVRPK